MKTTDESSALSIPRALLRLLTCCLVGKSHVMPWAIFVATAAKRLETLPFASTVWRRWLPCMSTDWRRWLPGLPSGAVLPGCWGVLAICLITGCKGKTDTNASGTKGGSKSGETVGKPGQADQLVFESIETKLGVVHQYSNGEETDQFTYLEAMGGGLGVLDFDNDGWGDLWLPAGGKITTDQKLQPLSSALFRNLLGQSMQDVTRAAHIDTADYYTQGIASGDINSDGFEDVLVTGFGGLNLFINQGDGTFIESARRWDWTTRRGARVLRLVI